MQEGLETGRLIDEALCTYAAEAVRFEYLAHQADSNDEMEVRAAELLRELGEAAHLHTKCLLELQEELGDVDFDSMADKMKLAAKAERANALNMRSAAKMAALNGLPKAEELFNALCLAAIRPLTN